MNSALAVGCFALLLVGCASRTVTFRALPFETPAADNAAAVANAAALGALASGSELRPVQAAPPLTPADAPSMRTYDPWERLNRVSYRFNAAFDESVLLPVSNGYRRVPSPVRAGVHNFFANLAEIDSIINFTLQGRLGRGARSLGRFLINSSIGIGGLLDVAAKFKLQGTPTGFAKTLARWGMHPGPYLVIPILGPSTLRDGIGFLGDFEASNAVNIGGLYRGNISWFLGTIDAIDQRSHTSFRYYSTGSPFEYETIRFLYVRKRLLEDEGLHPKKLPKRRRADVPAGR